jgi:HEAT repeat protein
LTAAALSATLTAANSEPLDEWIAKVRSKDDAVRGGAWPKAEQFRAAAVRPLVEVMADSDAEVARAAKRALWRIVHRSGRPGATGERNAVIADLLTALGSGSVAVRRELLWMLSEIGDQRAVAAIAPLLDDPALREDARCALQRVPGPQVTAALKAAWAKATTDFKSALAVSLRARAR